MRQPSDPEVLNQLEQELLDLAGTSWDAYRATVSGALWGPPAGPVRPPTPDTMDRIWYHLRLIKHARARGWGKLLPSQRRELTELAMSMGLLQSKREGATESTSSPAAFPTPSDSTRTSQSPD